MTEPNYIDISGQWIGLIVWVALDLLVFAVLISGVYTALTAPLRRAERSRMFINIIKIACEMGQPLEEALISIAQTRDLSMGLDFHIFAARLEEGSTFDQALSADREFLLPKIRAMLMAGRKIGDVAKILPACRQLLDDSVSETRAGFNYVLLLSFVITSFGVAIAGMLKIVVLPKFAEMATTLGDGKMPPSLSFVSDHLILLGVIQGVLLALLWLAGFAYGNGPQVEGLLPFSHRIQVLTPWKCKRLQRDFSTILALMLDSGMPEAEAVVLAGESTANKVFQTRARHAAVGLQQGLTLPEVITKMDGSGEFGWRLRNAMHCKSDFLRSLAGWHEALEAKAFQEEQAAAHLITTGLVLWAGVFTGAIVIAVFGYLTDLYNQAVLW